MAAVISVVGAGGKTTLIHRIKNEVLHEGKSVIVTTSTHMLREEDTYTGCDEGIIRCSLENHRYCMFGTIDSVNPKKICSPPEGLLESISEYADIVLIEADGARHHSVKYPMENEPVIVPTTDEIIILMGLFDIGKESRQVLFRYDYLKQLSIPIPDQISFSFINEMLIGEYKRKLDKMHFKGKITVLFSDFVNKELVFYNYEEAIRLYDK